MSKSREVKTLYWTTASPHENLSLSRRRQDESEEARFASDERYSEDTPPGKASSPLLPVFQLLLSMLTKFASGPAGSC